MENLALGDNISEYQLYWETNRFYQTEELDSLILDETLSGYYDSSSPDGAQSSAAANSKNIVSERNRRKKLLDSLHALRAVVPKITKMDKASIVKDAINYIQELHEQDRQIQAEISQLESMALASRKNIKSLDDFDHQKDQYRRTSSFLATSSLKKKKIGHQQHDHHHHGYDDSSGATPSSPIQLIELRVSYVQEKTVVVSLTCTKRRDTIIKLCEVFESLKLNIITASITTFSGTLLKTVFVEADEEEKDLLKIQIETAIAALHDPSSPMSG